MKQVSQQVHAERHLRVKDTIRALDFGTGATAYAAVQDRAAARLEDATTPDRESLEVILNSPHDYLSRMVKKGARHARPLIDLLCEVFADRQMHPSLTREQAKERYVQYIHHGVPFDARDLDQAVSGVEAPISPLPSIFPFSRLLMDEITPADGDKFFNAIPQGPDAAARSWLVRRYTQWMGLWAELRTATPGAWNVHFVGGASGSGKSTLLDLIAWEALNLGATVFRCAAECVDTQNFYDRLNLALASAGEQVIVLLDDVHKMEARNVALEPLLKMRPPRGNQTVTLVMAANWHVMRNRLPLHLSSEERGDRFHVMSFLSEVETDELLEIIREAERSGSITKMQCSMSQVERRSLISEERDRLILLALFKLRYARNIREALRDEFNSVSSEPARQLYTRVTIMESLGCPLPRSSLADLRMGALEVMPWLKGVVRVDSGVLRLGHPLLVRPTLDVVASDLDLRPDLLCGILVDLNARGVAGQQVLIQFFLGEGVSQRIRSFFKYESKGVRDYISVLGDHIEAFKATNMATHVHCHLGMLEKDVLLEFGQATYQFEDALELDPDNAYAAKQVAWSWLRLGDPERAEAAARAAIQKHPDDAHLLSDCAFIASWCSSEGSELAAEIYSSLLREFPDDEKLRRRWLRHSESEAVRQAAQGEFTEAEYELMKAPAFIWRVRRNASRQYKRALFGRLAGSLRESELDPQLLAEASSTEVVKGDARLTALLNANLARHLYERWYHEDEPVDLDDLESRFKTAIRLWPDEPFSHCWYGTFLKEARGDFEGAEREYLAAREHSKTARNPDFVDHPLIMNNLALLLMAKVYRQRASAIEALPLAKTFVDLAVKRMEETASKFTWPVDTQSRLQAMAAEFNISLSDF